MLLAEVKNNEVVKEHNIVVRDENSNDFKKYLEITGYIPIEEKKPVEINRKRQSFKFDKFEIKNGKVIKHFIVVTTIKDKDYEKKQQLTRANIIEYKISLLYSRGKEMKIAKNFLDWLSEDKPKNDTRESDYLTMKKEIKKIKENTKIK